MSDVLPIRVAALYHFTPFSDCARLRELLWSVCYAHDIRGTLLIAPEGINGTIAGLDTAIDEVLAAIRTIPGCADLAIKYSRAKTPPFDRMKVRIKREIVTMGQPFSHPGENTGEYITAENWNDLIGQPNTVVIDIRNDYEVALGSFAKAINPNIKTFREFPEWVQHQKQLLFSDESAPNVATFCTGGIRCEKATAYLRFLGLKRVYQLQGGILKYLETIDPKASQWHGECFVFDQRVALKHGLGLHENTSTDESKS
ncbi:MAG: rhodanese-like domain-containing protein [Acidocella sp.]|nr:rhodanese-like domain-containing protein [Acidocella sp.]